MNPQDRISSFQNEYLNSIFSALNQGKQATGGDAAACRAYLQSNEPAYKQRGFFGYAPHI